MYRRDRGRRYRDDDYVVEEVVVEEDPYYYDEEEGRAWWVSILGIFLVIAVLGLIAWLLLRSNRTRRQAQGPAVAQQQENLRPVPLGKPVIDLKAVEEALWNTKTSNPKDFKGWMKKFEDEVNAIYFATLRRQKPKADPATLMKEPVRVDPKRVKGLLYIYGYHDDNKKPGYQNGEDRLIFAFEQTKAHDPNSKKLHYSLRDSSGYYYRPPTYTHSYAAMAVTPLLLGFFVYPAIWYGMWWRPTFGWWGPGFWSTGFFATRYNHYYRSYPRYRRVYRRTYYRRHRPWGWKRGSYYRRGASGRHYSRTARYRSGTRNRRGSRYRSGTRNRRGSRYRSGTRNRSGSRYRRRSRPRRRSSYRRRSGSSYRRRSRGFGGRRRR